MDSFETALAAATNPTNRDLLGRNRSRRRQHRQVHHTHRRAPVRRTQIACSRRPALAVAARLDSLQIIEPSDVEPGFLLRPPSKKITLRHLLTHTSGLGGSDEALVEKWRESPAGVAHAAATADAHIIPGAGYCYGVSIYFAQLLVARIVGTTLGPYVQDNIFTPLGMGKSTFLPQARADVLEGLQLVQRTPDGLVPVDGETRDVSVSVRDLGVLLADLIGPASKILKKETVDLLFAPQLAEGGRRSRVCAARRRGRYPPLRAHGLPLGMPAGTVTWNGMPNVAWAMHRERGIAMVFATQLVPVDDEKVVKIQMEFFKGAWATYGKTA
ncbi:beta-lactamase/transpeptidase-like protein [Mycena leptocephala]|nr:beta-lactamase/transpeptidase-like protein [Mycena leptocephala]